MTDHYAISRTHRGGPETVVHAAPADLPPIEDVPWPTEPMHYGHTARMPGRRPRQAPSNPWVVRVIGWGLVVALVLTLWVLA